MDKENEIKTQAAGNVDQAAGNVDQAAEGSAPADEKKKKPLKPPTPEEIAKKVNAYMAEKVPYVFPLLLGRKKEEQMLYIAVNGRNYVIERGKQVKVPRAVIEVYENMVKQDILLAEYNAECLKQAEQI